MCSQGSEPLPRMKVEEELQVSHLYNPALPTACPPGMAVFYCHGENYSGLTLFYWSLCKAGNLGKKDLQTSPSTPISRTVPISLTH